MRIILSLALLCAAATTTGRYTAAPIMNLSHTTVIGPAGTPLSAKQVRGAIMHAGASLGWVGGGKIHRNYNGWIQNLSRNNNAQLAAS